MQYGAEALWEFGRTFLAVLGLGGVTIATLVGVAYALFRFLGEKWINNKFAEQLEAYKSEQTRELERLRHKINAVFDRTKRLNDREYEVLPDIWSRIVEAKGHADAFLHPFKQYADISRMTSGELSDFLSTKEFSGFVKAEIMKSDQKQRTYIDVSERYRYGEAGEKVRDAHLALAKSGIFVLPHLREDMRTLIDLIHAAIVEQDLNRDESIQPRLREKVDKLRKDGDPLFRKLEEDISARLWDSKDAAL